MTRQQEHYIPPLRYHWLTRFYDPLVWPGTREKAFKQVLLRQAAPRPGDQVLDLGCGTATLTIALAKDYLMATVTGIDADARALAIARGKARDSVTGALAGMLRAAGHEGVEETAKFDTPLGTMRLMRAARPRVPPSRESAA